MGQPDPAALDADLPEQDAAPVAPADGVGNGDGEQEPEPGYHEHMAALEREFGSREMAEQHQMVEREWGDEAEALRAEWKGADYGQNIAFATSFYDSIRTDALDELLSTPDEQGRCLGNSPEILRLAARLGRAHAAEAGNPDTMRETSTMSSGDRGKIEQQIAAIYKLRDGSWEDQQRWRQPATQERLSKLFEAMPGGDVLAIGSSGGPTA